MQIAYKCYLTENCISGKKITLKEKKKYKRVLANMADYGPTLLSWEVA